MNASPDILNEALGIMEDPTLAILEGATLDIVEVVVDVDVGVIGDS
jgi:hypothetical protein